MVDLGLIARIALVAALAVVAVYAYAALALVARARLATRPPPRTLAEAVLVGALTPACGCTALPFARRCAPRERAAFLTAAYACNPLLVLAAFVLGGAWVALAVTGLAVGLAFLAGRMPPLGTSKPKTRLDDLLLKPDSRPWRDGAAYLGEFGVPAFGVGAVAGVLQVAPSWTAGLALAVLALVMAPPRADLALDHGDSFAKRTALVHLSFALAAGATVGAVA